MIVALTFRELKAVQAAAIDRHAPYLADCVQRATNRHEVAMPPAAWRALLGPLRDAGVNAYGRWRTRAPGARAGLVKITGLLTALEVHPAMTGGVVPEGEGREVLTCFRSLTHARSPYPDVEPSDLLVLFPQEVMLEVDLGGGPVKVPGVSWATMNPHPSFGARGVFLDPDEHRGWSTD